jgi:uncharacterized protein (DUF1778 family)
MPTTLSRLPVTLTADQRRLLAKAAAVNGTSQSKILSELLDAAAPVLVRLIAAVENVQKLDAQKRDLIRATIEDAQAEAEAHAATALALLERISQPPADRPPETDAQRPPQEPPVVDLAKARRSHLAARRRPPTANRGGEK